MKNVDIKKTILANMIASIFLGLGAVLVIVGLLTIAPSISSNAEILRHAKHIAATISKSIYICGGLLISCISALKMKVVYKD